MNDRAKAEADLALIQKGVVERLKRNIFGYSFIAFSSVAIGCGVAKGFAP